MAYTVGLYTLGCKVSQYETEAIAEAFEALGFERRPYSQVCDVYVINTCTVTSEADRKGRQCIRRALHKNPDAVVMVCGCYAQTSPAEIAAIDGVSYITGTYGKLEIPRMALRLLGMPKAAPVIAVTPTDEAPFENMCVKHSPRTRAYVKIEDGCECRCTYCAIPGARGRVRSKPMDAIMEEVKLLAGGGTQEVVLTGIETASWGVDLQGPRLIDLLERLDAAQIVTRIRLGSLSPEVMTSDFVSRVAKLPTVTPHFHLSIQSGSDTILKAMRRRYLSQKALENIRLLREEIPDVQLTTDMMVGFPGETEALFLETMAFTEQARFLDMHIFTYSRRPGTPADTFPDQVSESVKQERSRRLMLLRDTIQAEILCGIVERGTPLRMIPETREGGFWHGHSDSFIPLTVTDGACVKQGAPLMVTPVSYQDGVVHTEIV